MSEVKSISVKDILSICKTLSTIVSRLFGPPCKPCLMSTSTGKLMITSDGIKLLKALHIGHPVAQVIIQSISDHHNCYGDGVKTFLLHLTGFFKYLSTVPMESQAFLSKIARKIPKFVEKFLPKCFESVSTMNVIMNNLSSELTLCSYMTSVLKSILSSHFTVSQTNLVSELIINALYTSSDTNNLTSILDLVDLYWENFEFVHIQCQQSYKASKLVNGVLLKDFTCCNHDLSKNNLQVILLRNTTEGNNKTEPEETIHISSKTNLDFCFSNNVTKADEFFKKLTSRCIELIITNGSLPQYMLALCKKYKISVIGYLDDKELEFVQMISGLMPLSNFDEELKDKTIGEITLCHRVKYGSRVYVNLYFKEMTVMKSFILCAPTDGLTFELSTLVSKSLKTLQMASNRRILQTPDKYLRKSGDTVSKLEICDLSDSKRFNIAGNSIKVERDLLHHNNDDPEVNFQINLMESSTDSNADEMLVIPGGGLFEFQLAKAIMKSSNNFKHPEFGYLSKIIYEMILSIPRTLHSNMCTNSATEERHFTHILHTILNSDVSLSLNLRGDVYNPSSSCPSLESFYLKVATLGNALQLIQQLLKLDMIIGVKHSN